MSLGQALSFTLWGVSFLTGVASVLLVFMWNSITEASRKPREMIFFGVLLINGSLVCRFLLSGVLTDPNLVALFQFLINAVGLIAFSWLIWMDIVFQKKSGLTWLYCTCFVVSTLLIATDLLLIILRQTTFCPWLDLLTLVTTLVLVFVNALVTRGLKHESSDSLETWEAKRLVRREALILLIFLPFFVGDRVWDSFSVGSGFRWGSVALWVLFANPVFVHFFYRWVFHHHKLAYANTHQTSEEGPPRREDEQRFSISRDGAQKRNITEREWSVIELISRGLTNQQIAWDQKISVSTVKNHISNIYKKVKVQSRIELLNALRGS